MNHGLIFGLAAIVIIMGGPTSYFIHANQSIVEMVKAGASPAEAKCAIDGDRNGTACLTAALLRSIEGNAK